MSEVPMTPSDLFSRREQEIEADEVPRSLITTASDLQQRRFLCLEKWLSVSRPQYSSSCGLSSLTAVWNYLFGIRTGRLLSVEEVGEILGFEPPLRSHGLFYVQTNTNVMKWFLKLCEEKRVQGDCRILFKLQGSRRTNTSPDQALFDIMQAIQDPSSALIYHCESHFMCLVGYELSPTLPTDALRPCAQISSANINPWLIAADSNGKKAPLHCFQWTDVMEDLSLLYPAYLNIRRTDLGIQEHRSQLYTTGDYHGRNIHCIMIFKNTAQTSSLDT